MKIKHLLTKTLLVAAGLLLGGANSVWADAGDVTTVVDINFSNAITDGAVAGTKGSMTIYSNSPATEIADGTTSGLAGGEPAAGTLLVGKGTWNSSLGYNVAGIVNIPATDRAGYAHTAEGKNFDIVTITFKMAFGNLAKRYMGFAVKDADGADIAAMQRCRYGNYGGTESTPFGANSFGLEASDFHSWSTNSGRTADYTEFTLTFNYKDKTMSCKTGQMATAKTVPMTNTNPVAQFLVVSNYDSAPDRRNLFDDLVITNKEGDYSVATANYTVKFKCGDEEIKTASVRSGDVDDAISLFPVDKENFYNGDESKRYIYVSDDASEKTVASNGSTVVTVTFREAEKWSYDVTSSCGGNLLAFTNSGSVWEDLNTVTVRYPKFQAYGSTLVYGPCGDGTGNPKTTITVTNDSYKEDIVYTASEITNLYLVSEAEELGTGLSTSSTSFQDRVSKGQIIYGASGTLLTLPAGKYIFTLGAIGGDNSTHKVEYVVKAGEETIASGTCIGNNLVKFTGDEFTLTKSTAITFTCSDPASSRGIDLIYVQKTGDATEVSATITSAGWATLYTPYALDFSTLSSEVEAYTATLSGTTVTLNKVSNVPANTGIVLKKIGGSGSYNIPVIASSTTEKGDLQGNASADTPYDAGTNRYYLALNGESKAQFKKLTSGSIAAGKAFLQTAVTAPVLNVVFGDDNMTGIADVRSKMEDVRSNIFDLQGRKVAQPQKGLYIVNGKKVVIK